MNKICRMNLNKLVFFSAYRALLSWICQPIWGWTNIWRKCQNYHRDKTGKWREWFENWVFFIDIVNFILPSNPYSDDPHREEKTADTAYLQSFHPTISWSRNLECQDICRTLSCLSKYLAKHFSPGTNAGFWLVDSKSRDRILSSDWSAQEHTDKTFLCSKFCVFINICWLKLSQSSQTEVDTLGFIATSLWVSTLHVAEGFKHIAEKYLVSSLQLKCV